jgi:hypothetical protein
MKKEREGPNKLLIIGIPVLAVCAAVAVLLILNPCGIGKTGKDGKAITLSQYEEVKRGMSYEQVTDILGTKGELQSETGEKGSESYLTVYAWKGLADDSKAVIVFSGGKVASKTHIGLTDE